MNIKNVLIICVCSLLVACGEDRYREGKEGEAKALERQIAEAYDLKAKVTTWEHKKSLEISIRSFERQLESLKY